MIAFELICKECEIENKSTLINTMLRNLCLIYLCLFLVAYSSLLRVALTFFPCVAMNNRNHIQMYNLTARLYNIAND